MSEKPVHEIWWEQLSGSARFLREAVETLQSGRHLCLAVPKSLPWREYFIGRLKDAVLEFDNALLFEELDCNGYEKQNPGEILIDHFELSAGYRPTKTFADFLSQSRALHGRVMCVRTDNPDSAVRWLDFARGYKPPSRRGGLIFLETPDISPGGVPRHIRLMPYKGYISEYDTQIFAGLLLSGSGMSTEQKKYVMAIAVSLLGANATEVVDFLKSYRYNVDDPERFAPLLPGDDISRRVWNAQVQTLFPLIMRECREFIDKWRDRVEQAFEHANAVLPNKLQDSNREPIASVDEMEIAAIRFLMRNRRRDAHGFDTEEYMLYIPDENARARVELLYEARNRIAHGKLCPVEQVVNLLS